MNTSPDRNSSLKVASGLGAALAFIATEASAAINYTAVEGATASVPCYGGVYTSFNPITGATNAAQGYSPINAIALRASCGGSTQFIFGCTSGTITSVGFQSAPVTAGHVIDSSGTWFDSDFSSYGSIANASFSGHAYTEHLLFAYRFKTTDDANTYLYGWTELSAGFQGSTGYVGLYAYAYESSGGAITAGAIPEPGMSAAIFGLAAFALIGFRRIRQRTVRA
ncbi:hypothetical protein [Rariglobus hedericola]|uniref:hypothetical protein n=1 Tax=Rariglobus hedericola TaxID=2597822 RepID=UPI00139688D7|nr:hypothetical protein [Rariglobus hedericola]